MTLSLADAQFAFARAVSLLRRGVTSLGTRGWKATWQRVTTHFGVLPPAQRRPLMAGDYSPFKPFSVPLADDPQATVVIPVFNAFEHTLACLRAISQAPPQARIEVLVVDDGSSDESANALPLIEGLQYHRRASNGGFIAACNDGAQRARGEFLVFLNNDTIPQPGWLDALLRTFHQHPNAGLVGAQLLYPDGRLQESGAWVMRDGRGESRGRFDDPDDPLLRFAVEVDYCSGAALAICRDFFHDLKGFDPIYSPAYYEDTDLAFRVQAAGKKVLCQPEARVVHVEGASSGTDLGSGVKAAQRRNQPLFAARWNSRLATHPVGPPDHLAHDRQRARTVLIVDALTPTPDRDSGSLRMVNLICLLRDEGAHVVFVPADRKHAGVDTERLQALGVEVWYHPYLRSIPRWMKKHGRRFSAVIASRHYVAQSFLPLVRRHAPQAKMIFDSVDLHYLRERRAAELTNDPRLRRVAERTRRLELGVMARSDVTFVVSGAERELLARDAPGIKVEVVSNLHEVAGSGLPYSERKDLVFVGGFRHPPNIDAVRWFAAEVFPLIRASLHDVTFHCIGGDLVPEIVILGDIPGVKIHGHVPDITPYMEGCRIAVAPLRYGAGVKGKINLSMAHGQPVVATGTAVEGMHLRHGHDVLVADNPAEFAEAVIKLYRNGALWQQLSMLGHENIRAHFSPDAARDTVRATLFDRS